MFKIRNGNAIVPLVVGTILLHVPLADVNAQNPADNLVREFYAWYPCVEPTTAYRLTRLNPQLPRMILMSARPERDRFAAFSCIVGARVPGYKAIVIQALRDPSERIRSSAVHCLPQALEEEALVKELVRMLDDPSGQVRHNSLEVMGRCPTKAALESLFGLAQHESTDMRHGAVSALLARNDEEARVQLRALCQSPNVTIAGPAAAALAQISSEPFEFEAIAAYLRYELPRPKGGMSKYLIDTIGRRGDKGAIAVLDDAAKHEDKAIREAAAKAVTQIQLRAGMEFDKLLN